MKYVLYKVKVDKLDQWNDWCKKLSTEFKEQALETMKQEGVTVEGFITFQLNDDWYSLAVTDFYDGVVSKENELNYKHSVVKKDCLEFVIKGDSDTILSIS